MLYLTGRLIILDFRHGIRFAQDAICHGPPQMFASTNKCGHTDEDFEAQNTKLVGVNPSTMGQLKTGLFLSSVRSVFWINLMDRLCIHWPTLCFNPCALSQPKNNFLVSVALRLELLSTGVALLSVMTHS
ncbi:unnamed protein product [Protopolystoma xenopodis]|uniref:Uncharacterized protein n=1 Tax=Protopolystoma xenopodis TaxID=117903 RepID=A0A448WQF0_9PLAT|nr:unnamed protein product [Protopolystoma xenopodis]